MEETTGQKFLFELKRKKAGEAVIGEVVFIPAWLNAQHEETLNVLMNGHKKEEDDYQQVTKFMIQKKGWMVVNILRESLILFPISRGKFQKRLFIGLNNYIISTGKIVEVGQPQ